MKHTNAQTRLKHSAQETPKEPLPLLPAAVSVVNATSTSTPGEDEAEAGTPSITALPRTVEPGAMHLDLGY